MFKILFISYLFCIRVHCLPTEISIVNSISNKNFSITTDENSKQIIEQDVDFDYNEDYSQNNSEESNDYIEFTTQKLNGPNNDSLYPSVSTIDEYDLNLNSLQNVKTHVEENAPDNNQAVLNQLASVFNIGDISSTKIIPADFMVPQFMTDLYHTITDQNNDALQTIAYGASAIISLPEMNPSTPDLFKFDLSGISAQDILEAELHVYRVGREVYIPLHHSPYYLLRVYQVLANNNLMSWNPDVHQLLNVHYVSSFITGWQVFKVKRALDSWLNESAPNLGFLITASTVVNEPIDINFARKNRYSNKYQPSLVLFTKPKSSMENKNHNNYNVDSVMENENSEHFECTKTALYINFTTDYFNNFVVEPKGYDAYQCTGMCKYPENLQSPNYSVLKAALKGLGTLSSNICCVPEKMKYLIVLYLSGEKIVLQRIDNMVVETCSCR